MLHEFLKIARYAVQMWAKLLLRIAIVSVVCLAVYNVCLVDTTHVPLSFRAMYGIIFILSFILN